MKNKTGEITYDRIIFVIIVLVLVITLVTALSFGDDTDSNWNLGTMINMEIEGTDTGANLTSNKTTGGFLSRIFNAGSIVDWKNITYSLEYPYGEELPANQVDENYMNMTGNVLLMHFNNDSSIGENDTHVYDWSGSGRNGTVSNGTITTAGKFGNAIEFTADGVDGIDVNVGGDNDINPNKNFTASLWFKKAEADFTINSYLVDRRGTNHVFYLYTSNGNSVAFAVYNESGALQSTQLNTGTNSVQDTNWHHVVAGYNGNIFIYLDGVYKSGGSINGEINIGSGAITIGKNFISLSEFNGTIDEVAIWNRSLSADEIKNLYNRGAARLNVSVRSCDDSACSGETWNTTNNNASFGRYNFLTDLDNRYFQYMFNYTNDSATTVRINNISILYDDISSPVITLISPTNNSGDSDGNLTFNYNVTDISSITNCSLIINNIINQTNSSITKDTTQNFTLNNLAVASYNWSINCTDAVNKIGSSETRIFSVVKTTEFSGSTTDLTSVNISNITNLIIDQPSHGKINFSENVDLSDGGDLNEYVNISFNRIEINSTALLVLNKSARLRLYNLTYSNPRVLKDGSVCSDCTEVSYSGGTFIFDVISFSIYSAEETPTTTEEITTSSPGGGYPIFLLSQKQLQEGYEKTLRKNWKMRFKFENEMHQLKINSIWNKTVEITISSEPITFNLSSNNIKKINLDNDSYYDLKIFLKDVRGTYADLVVKLISEKIPERVSEEEKIVKEIPKEKDIFSIVFYFLGGGVILGIVFALYLFIKKKKLVINFSIKLKNIRERRRKKREERKKKEKKRK